ncbi:serine/threonine-protein kinase H1 homolog [Biomphalaria glabrata]|uniref:Serine/threonine-protein kinase H1 homolog n=1 Tax=Biomphalaria glabrata TaxID=6526 RepID=A0A9U8EBM1_BIOGL|nr:serine/threonine-protein kinase H1 homolog [Biomphalaria glabrata]
MGCMSTKLVPETPPNPHLVETVFRQDANTRNNRHYADNQAQTHLRLRDTAVRQSTQVNNEINQEHGQRTNKKVKKYRDKFDSKVTAKYDIKALIGRGSFSRVVRAEHRITKQPYAIKMIDRVQGKEVFEAELNVLRRVKHVYIIQLVEVFEFEASEKVYMVMELATGGELFDRIIAKGSFTERDATRVLTMVLDGVKYLHGLGITHRDLKPENLLYYHPGHDSKIMITDFGLSAMVKGPDNLMRTTCGTPEYIAPEILARKPYTSQVDLWAIGVITYILLSGTMPFDDENRTRLYRMIIKAKYSYAGEHWKDVSALAKDFIDKTLVLDPNERMTASQACIHPWLRQNAHVASSKNLHRTISQNLLRRQSQRANSTKSAKSTKSTKSNKSNKSGHSLRSDRRRVQPEEIDELHKDPEVQADLASLGSHHSNSA